MATTANGRYYAGIVDPTAAMYPQDPGMDAAAAMFSTPGLASEFLARKAAASQGREQLLAAIAQNNMMRSQLATSEMANERNMKLGGDLLQFGDKAGVADIPTALAALLSGGNGGLSGALATPVQNAVTASRVQNNLIQPQLNALDIIGKAGSNFDPGKSGNVLDLLMSGNWYRNPSNVMAANATGSHETKPKVTYQGLLMPNGELTGTTVTSTAGDPSAAQSNFTTATGGGRAPTGTPRQAQSGQDVEAVQAAKRANINIIGTPQPATETINGQVRKGYIINDDTKSYFYDPATKSFFQRKMKTEAPKP